MRSKIVLGLLVATIAYACLAMARGTDVEAAGGSYLMARFWDNKNFSSLLWEHYYEYICPQQPGYIGM